MPYVVSGNNGNIVPWVENECNRIRRMMRLGQVMRAETRNNNEIYSRH